MRILLVAASPSDAHLAQRTLRRGLGDGVHVVHVDRLSQALDKLQTVSFDVTVLDLELPDASDLDALTTVIERHPHMPVLVLINWGDDDLGVRAIQAGAQDSVIKSLGDIQRLCRSVTYALERSKRTPDPAAPRREASPDPSVDRALEHVGNLVGAALGHTANIERRTEPTAIRQMYNVADLIEENMDDLAFFGLGGRGRTLPAYLRAMADRLAKETRTAHADVERLGEVLDEMAGAISTRQQEPARNEPSTTTCDVDRLVMEILGLQQPRSDAAEVQVSTDLRVTRHCQLDPQRMQVVLEALVSNAIDALAACNASPRRLLIRTRLAQGIVRIDIGDNGIGIAPAVGSRMFGFRYTTKPGREGFGLHRCATAVQAMGGRLTWRSRGAGKGAVFTVECPQVPNELAETLPPEDQDTLAPDAQETVFGPIVVDTH